MSRIQSQIIFELLTRGKYWTRRDRDTKVQRSPMQIQGINLGGAFDP